MSWARLVIKPAWDASQDAWAASLLALASTQVQAQATTAATIATTISTMALTPGMNMQRMAMMHTTMRIVDIAGKCPNGHRVGEEYTVANRTPAGICLGSFSACLPYVIALRHGASFPWEKEEGTITLGCPDHVNLVTWKLTREGG